MTVKLVPLDNYAINRFSLMGFTYYLVWDPWKHRYIKFARTRQEAREWLRDTGRWS